jgi:hypothetical protein
VVLTILAVLGCIVGGLLLVVLLMPIQAQAEGRFVDGELDGRATLRWGFGAVTVRTERGDAEVRLFGVRVRRGPAAAAAEKPRPRRERRRSRRGLGWAMRNRGVLFDILRRALRLLHLRARITGTVGLGDPADSAMLFLILGEIERGVPGLGLAIDRDYLDEVLDLDGTVRGWLWPVAVVAFGLGLLLRRRTRRVLVGAA